MGSMIESPRIAMNMTTYDALPQPVREVIAAARYSWSPVEAAARLANGYSVADVAEIIRTNDAMLAMQRQVHGTR